MNIYEEKRTFSELEECKETLTEAQADTKPASRRGNVMKSGVHSPLTGNHPLALCRIYSDGFTQATGWERKKNQHRSAKWKQTKVFPNHELCGGRVWWKSVVAPELSCIVDANSARTCNGILFKSGPGGYSYYTSFYFILFYF